jgi:hypothetical protein
VDWQSKYWQKDEAMLQALLQKDEAMLQALLQKDEAKDEVVSLWQDKENLWKDREGRLEEELTSVKEDFLKVQVKAHAVVHMRLLIEIAARNTALESPLRLFVSVSVCVRGGEKLLGGLLLLFLSFFFRMESASCTIVAL